MCVCMCIGIYSIYCIKWYSDLCVKLEFFYRGVGGLRDIKVC